jgi:hypothetical protein
MNPFTKYWQHDETGRVVASSEQPGSRWYEITPEQYDAYTLREAFQIFAAVVSQTDKP